MLIGELAKKADVPIDTIRFYEKRDLLKGEHFVRKDNTYRDYTEAAVARLQLIKQGQAAGLTLTEMSRSIHEWEADAFTTEHKRAFFQGKGKEIEARITALEHVKYPRLKTVGLYQASTSLHQRPGGF